MVSRRVRRVLKKFRNIARDKQSVRNPNYAVASRMVSEINSTVHQLYTEDDYETLKKLFEILQMDITGYEDKKYQVITPIILGLYWEENLVLIGGLYWTLQ